MVSFFNILKGIKKISIKTYLVILVLSIFMTGCGVYQSNSDNTSGNIKKITAEEAKKMMDEDKEILIIDVREENEYNEGHIKNSVLVPLGTIDSSIGNLAKEKEEPILVYCRSGRRSAEAANILNELGYTNIYDFGGIIDWNYEIEK